MHRYVLIKLNLLHVYLGNAAYLPQLVPDQAVKLKQLSVLTLAEMNKVSSLIFVEILIVDSPACVEVW